MLWPQSSYPAPLSRMVVWISLTVRPLCYLSMKACLLTADLACTQIVRFQRTGCQAVELACHVSKLPTCLWRLGLLSWKVGCGKDRDARLSPQDLASACKKSGSLMLTSPPHICGFSHFSFWLLGIDISAEVKVSCPSLLFFQFYWKIVDLW